MHAVFGVFHGGSDRTQSSMVPTEAFRWEVLEREKGGEG
jgi:hypothetical protein